MPNDARNKLRNMGGIMASYPELMQETQYYQTGGNVRIPDVNDRRSPLRVIPPMPQMVQPSFGPRTSGYAPGLLPTGIVDSRISGSSRIPPVSPEQARRNLELEQQGINLRDLGPVTTGGGATPYPTAPDRPFERRDPRGIEAGLPGRMNARVLRNVLSGEGSMGMSASDFPEEGTIDNLLEGSGASTFTLGGRRSAGEVGAPEAGEAAAAAVSGFDTAGGTSAGPTTPAQRRAERINQLRQRSVQSAAEYVQNLPDPVSALQDYANQFGTEAAGVVASFLGATDTGAKFLETAEGMRTRQEERAEAGAEEPEAGSTLAPPRAVYDNPVFMANLLPPNAESPDRAEELRKQAEEQLNKDAATVLDPDTGGAGGGAGGQSAPLPSKKTLRDRYKEKIDLFKEIYGTDDEERARDRAMSLAMLGLAIASGQSPNALTNIAQGAMAGVQGMSEQEMARRERDRGLQSLALESAIGDMSAEQEAVARAAEAEYDRETRYEVERIRAEGGGSDSPYTEDRLRQLVTDNITSNSNDYPALLTKEGSLDAKKLTKFVEDVVKGVSSPSGGGAIPAPPNTKPGQRIRDTETGVTYTVQEDNTMIPEG